MNRRIFFIALVLSLPLALILPLRTVRSWQPRVTALPLVATATVASPSARTVTVTLGTMGGLCSGDLLWRANGLWLVSSLIEARKIPPSIVNWNGERVPLHAFSAETLDLSRDGKTVALLKFIPYGGNAIGGVFTVHVRGQGAPHQFPAQGINQHFAFQVTQLVISPDGTRVAWNTSAPDGAIIADTRTGRTLAHFKLPARAATSLVMRSQIGALAFSSDGRELAVTTSGALLFVDATTGKVRRRCKLSASAPDPTRALWSPDGTKLALYTGQRFQFAASAPVLKAQSVVYLRVINARTGQELRSWSQTGTAVQPQGVTNVAFSPDGTRLAWGTWSGEAKMMNLKNGAIERDFPIPVTPLNVPCFVAFAPDGNSLAVASHEKIKLWRVR